MREVVGAGAELLQDVEAVHLGQPEVEIDQVRGIGAGAVDGLPARNAR